MKLGSRDKYGTWSLLIAITSITGLIVTLRLSDAMIRLLSGVSDVRQREQRFFSILAVALILSVVTAALFANWQWFIDRFFGTDTDARAVQAGLFFTVAQAIEWIVLDSFRTFDRLRAYAFTTILRTWSLVLMIFILLFLSVPFAYLMASVLALRTGIAILAVINIAEVEKMSLKRWLQELNVSFLPSYLAYASPMLCAGLFTLVLNSGDRLVLGYFEDVSTVGIYSACYTVGSLGAILVGPIQMSLYPSISRFWNTHRYGEARTYANLAFQYYILLAMPVTVSVCLLADIILNLLASIPVSQSGRYVVVSMIAVGTFFYGVHSIALLIITLSKRVWTIALIVAMFGALNILLNVLLIGVFHLGLMGAALANMVAFALMAAASYLVACRYLQSKLHGLFILKVILSALTMAFVLYASHRAPIWGRLLSAAFGTAAYFLLLTLTRVIPLSKLRVALAPSVLKELFRL
jgi:O-antigen/teichoic acid export membrane protein